MSKRKILLADDSETVQKVVNLTFELEGIEVVTFSDGDSAMAQFSTVAPDVVLADVNMPGMSGYDICQNIKSNETTKNTPVILLVGSFEPFDQARAAQVGADDYLTKPFQSIRQLVSKVNELLSNKTDVQEEEAADNFTETLEMNKNIYEDSALGDAGMDDEMIQTSQIGSLPADETVKYQTPVSLQNKTDDFKTQPLSDSDWREIYSAEQDEDVSETKTQTIYELADAEQESPTDYEQTKQTEDFMTVGSDFAETNEIYDEPSNQPTTEKFSYEANAVSFEDKQSDRSFSEYSSAMDSTENQIDDEFGRQPDDIEYFYKEPDNAENNDVEISEYTDSVEKMSFEDQPEQNVGASSENESDLASENHPLSAEIDEPEENIAPENTQTNRDIEMENEKKSGVSQVPMFDFEDFDLLEESFPESESLDTDSDPKESETEMSAVEEVAETEHARTKTEQVKSEVAEQLSGINLSAADIDAIAEKVVEKLSARMKE